MRAGWESVVLVSRHRPWLAGVVRSVLWLLQGLTICLMLAAAAAGGWVFVRYTLLPLLISAGLAGLFLLGLNYLFALSGCQERLRDEKGRHRPPRRPKLTAVPPQ